MRERERSRRSIPLIAQRFEDLHEALGWGLGFGNGGEGVGNKGSVVRVEGVGCRYRGVGSRAWGSGVEGLG